MGKRRMITESSSETAANKLKKSRINKNNESDDFYDPNTLIAMPDHILEKIFDSLDFASKKSFSESCFKFDGIFSQRKNLDKVWFRLNGRLTPRLGGKLLSNISRTYTSLIWNCHRETPEYLSTHLAPNLTSLIIVKTSPSPVAFIDALPCFTNIKFLELVVPYASMKHLFKSSEPRRVDDLVEMKHLEHLEISYELFCYLDGHHIEFAATKKLHTLILYRLIHVYGHCISNQEFSILRALISSQPNLKKLNFLGANFGSIFNLQFEVPMLEEFIWTPRKYLNDNELDNFWKFVNSQPNLKCLPEIYVNMRQITEKLKQLLMNSLNLPLKIRRMFVFERENLAFLGNFNFLTDPYELQDLLRFLAIEPNIATEELELNVCIHLHHQTSFNQLATFIVTKFPNLKSMKIKNYSWRLPGASFSALSNLQNLNSLEIEDFVSGHLTSITIPTLKRFRYHPRLCANEQDLIEFLSRHEKIQEFIIDFDAEIMNFKAVVNFALVNLKDFSRFTWRSNPNYRDLKSILPMIKMHAKPGFVFTSSSMEIMKRFDNEIVKKSDDKWQIIQ